MMHRRLPLRSRWLLAIVAALGSVTVACVPPPSPGPGPTTTTSTTSTTTTTLPPAHVMSVGHADVIDVDLVGSTLVLQITDDAVSPPVVRNPTQTILHAKPGAWPAGSQLSVPANPAFSFLGNAGDPVWILPEVQNANLLWPGLSTERISSGVLQGNQVQVHLESVSGPGAFHLYNVNAFGQPVIRYSSTAPLPQILSVSTNTHAHYSWAFSATGTYTLTFRASATLANGTAVTTPPIPYTFRVGAL